MNKIYKVVWNTVRNCYVVGSELISSKSGRHSTSNDKSSSLKVTLTVLALCGMTALGSGVAPAYAADAGMAVASQYVAVLVNKDNNYYTSRGRTVQYGDTRYFDGHSYHKETVSGETYWVRDGYSIKYEENERYPGAQKNNIIKAYKTSSYTADSDEGLLKSNQIMVESAGISTLTGVDLDNVSGGTYVGATNSGSTSTPSSFNYMIKDDNGTYVDAGNTNFSKRFKAATKNTDGTYSYNGEVIANDNLYVVNEQVGVFLTSSGKVYTGKVFGANNEVLMTTKSDSGTMYSYWGADTPDPNTKLADMTIGQFNQALEKVNNNSKAVAGDTIKEIKTTAKTDGGTIDLVRRGQYNSATGKYEGEYTVGDGITITSHGGTNGEDVKINFSNGTTGFDVAAGSKVEAVGTKEATTGLKINGETYNIKTGQTYTEGDNITIDGNIISATDTTLVAGKAEKKGDSYIVKDTAGNEVTLEDVASANELTEVNNRVTKNTQDITNNTTNITNLGEKLKGAVMYDSTDTGFNKNNVTLGGTPYDSTTKTGGTKITNLARGTNDSDAVNFSQLKEVEDAENYVTDGSLSTTDGTITLNRLKDGPVTITGLKDYVKGIDSYVTRATLNGNTLTLARNQGLDSLTVNLGSLTDGLSSTDYRLIASATNGGKYVVKNGEVNLTVQDAQNPNHMETITISGLASAADVNESKVHYFSVYEQKNMAKLPKNYNNDGATGDRAIAIGVNASASGKFSVAIGSGQNSDGATTSGNYATAVGNGSLASGESSMALGYNAKAINASSVAVGNESLVNGSNSMALGASSAVGNQDSIVDSATAVGSLAHVYAEDGTALGENAEVLSKGKMGTALGTAAKVKAREGTAIGAYSSVSAEGGVAVGKGSVANRAAGMKGYAPVGEAGISPVWKATDGAVSLGSDSSARTRQITNLAAGTENTDAVNVAQLKRARVELTDGTNTTVKSTNDQTDGHVIYSVDVKTNGTINEGDTNIVTGDTVYNALQNVSWTAKVNGTDAKTVAKDGTLNFIDSDNIAITSTADGDIQIFTKGLASSGDLWTAQAGGKDVKAVDQKVNFNSTDKHLVVESTQDGEITFATKDLADTSFTNITEKGNTYIKKLAKGEDVHIEAKEYAVNDDGSVTMTYVDGNRNTVDGTAKITGIAKSDLTNITEGGKKVINNLAKEAVKVVGGMNTTVESSTTTDGPVEYKVNLNEDVNLGDTIYLNGSDGSISAKSGGAQLAFNNSGLTVSQAKNGLTNETRIDGATITVDGGAGNQTIINGSTARIGGVLVNGGSGTATISGLTNQTTKYDGFANGSGRAATEEQLKEVNSKATAAKTTVTAGNNIEVKGQSDANGSTYTVALADDVSLGNNAIQLKGSDGSISATSGTSSLNFNNKGLSLSNDMSSTVINGGTITVNGGESVISGTQATFGKINLNAESGSTITGLSNTTTDYTGFANGSGRAATEEQLKEVAGQAGEAIETAGKGWNLTTNGKEASKTNIKPGGTVDFSSNNDNLVISNAGADLSFSLSDNLDLTKNDSKKGSVKVGENTALTNELLQVGKDVSLTASALNVGNSSLTTDTLKVGGIAYITSSGLNANGQFISNVKAGVLDTDAVNVGQLKSAISGSQVSIKAGDGISVNKAGNQYTINVNIEGLSNEHGTVHVSTDSDPSVVSKSTPTESETITPAPAKRMNSLLLAEEAVAAEPENGSSTGKKMYVKYTSNEVKLITDDITKPEDAVTLNDGEKIDFVGGKNITTSSDHGTDTDSKNYDKITFSLKDDISVTSVTADKVTINNGPTINENGIDMNGKSITNVENITVNNGPTINNSGIDMNSQKITNLADGEIAEGSTDAVNGGQLYNTNQAVIANAENINSLSHSLNKLDSRINRVGAGAAALAALHPLDFDPDNKWDFAAGYGNYAGANAVAIGTYYRPNENTMFSIGGSFGGGENMINAGVSFKFGSGGSGITTSKTVMAKKIKEQDELLKAQDAKMKEQDEKIAKLEALVAQQGEMIQQALGKK